MNHFVKTALAIALTTLSTYSLAADNTTNTTTTTNATTTNTNNAGANPLSNAATNSMNPTANVSPQERAKIESVIHEYLLNKPEVLMEAIQVLQRKQYQQAEQTIKNTQTTAPQFVNALFHQASDPVAGNPNGAVTVVEFFDYQCPHCVNMAPVITDIIKKNPNVRFVFKEFPIRGPISEVAARAALAANLQGKYFTFSHALLTAPQPLTQDIVYQVAKEQGLNVEKLKKDMNDPKVSDQLKANIKLAQDLKLFGTPAFFVGKSDTKTNISYVPGQLNQEQLQDMITKANSNS